MRVAAAIVLTILAMLAASPGHNSSSEHAAIQRPLAITAV